MAHTYYSRLTLVHPQDIKNLDPRSGIVIAETATTGRYVLSDISWETHIAPNALTVTAMHGYGDMKIYEPLGMSLFDYIKAAAWQLGMENHLDARFLLEIEIISENMPKEGSEYKYIWPIMFISNEVKASVMEKGTEYNVRYIPHNYHSQTDLVQPIKETTKLSAGTVGEYFQKLQNTLETKEYKYAEARQKAGKTAAPGGDNPAAQDDYHDEYHFIIQNEIAKFSFTNKGKADSAVQGAWLFGIGGAFGKFNVTARPGTTLVNHINKVLQGTKESADLLLGKKNKNTDDAQGTSDANKAVLESQIGKVYKFFRVETHSVYKSFDYIRQRHAVKHVFFVYLADQPDMYHYPDELSLLNKEKNKDKVVKKLQYYIQEGLLQKLYYYNYTGLNTDIIKVDLNFNNAYSLPSFPVVWADRHETGPGAMNKQNYNRRLSSFAYGQKDSAVAIRQETEVFRRQARRVNDAINGLVRKYAKGDEKLFRAMVESNNLGPDKEARDEYNKLKKYQEQLDKDIKDRENAYNTKLKESGLTNSINSRSELLASLQYVEDYDADTFQRMLEHYLTTEFPNLIPRMEPDALQEDIDIVKIENEKLIEKIFTVMTAPNSLINLEMEIFADPFWLGMPNVMTQGSKALENIFFTSEYDPALKALLNSKMPKIDPEWATREPVWKNYGVAPHYQGSPLIYFLNQIPDGQYNEQDMLTFAASDQIVGIYAVWNVVNELKEGKWTQKLKALRDLTIPSQFLPKSINGEFTMEQFREWALDQPSVADELRVQTRQEEDDRRAIAERENLTGNGSGAAGVQLGETASSKPGIAAALEKQKAILASNPPPRVDNPVSVAEALVASGKSKKEAYETAKARYEQQLGDFYKHIEAANIRAYAEAGVSGVKPYSADTMKALALQRDGVGGLNNWKVGNTTMLGPSALNNPMGVGGNPTIGRYGKYNSWEDGLKAGSDYYNYGVGVTSTPSRANDRLLLPSSVTGGAVNELKHISIKSAGGRG
jgi:hypothetical protein